MKKYAILFVVLLGLYLWLMNWVYGPLDSKGYRWVKLKDGTSIWARPFLTPTPAMPTPTPTMTLDEISADNLRMLKEIYANLKKQSEKNNGQ